MVQLATMGLNATAIALMAVSQPDPAKPGQQKVDVNVQSSDLNLVKEGDRWVLGLELGLVVDGAPADKSVLKTFRLSLTDAQRDQVMKSGFLIDGSIATQTAQDLIRVIVREPATGASGSLRVSAGQ